MVGGAEEELQFEGGSDRGGGGLHVSVFGLFG